MTRNSLNSRPGDTYPYACFGIEFFKVISFQEVVNNNATKHSTISRMLLTLIKLFGTLQPPFHKIDLQIWQSVLQICDEICQNYIVLTYLNL